MKKNLKISFYPIAVILAYFFCIIRLSYVPNINNYALIIDILLFIFLFLKGAVTKNYKYRKINFSLFIFGIFSVVSSIVNMKNVDGTLLYILKIIDITLLVQYVTEIKKDVNSSKILFFLSVIMTFVTISYQMTHPLFAWKNGLNYFIGTKFSVSYNAISSMIFYQYAFGNGKHKNIFNIIFIILFGFVVYTCDYVKCMTGVIGAIICFIFIILAKLKKLKSKKTSVLLKSNTAILIFIISAISVLVLEKIISIPIIENLITNTLGKSSDLSGRLIVYKNYPVYLKDHILFGYGYNNVYELFKDTMKIRSNSFACNAQNALLEYILYFGLFGTSSFIVFVKNSFKRLGNLSIDEMDRKRIFILGFYLLVFLGIIEITINPLFYLFLSLIACGEKKGERDNEKSGNNQYAEDN
mgnify:FL=1